VPRAFARRGFFYRNDALLCGHSRRTLDNESEVLTKTPNIILLAEDDPNDVIIIKKALESVSHEHKIRHVRNGDDCIHYLAGTEPYDDRDTFPFPSFLLLDLKMPGQDGFDVLKWLRAHPEVILPVIVLTGSGLPKDKAQSLDLGAREFHSKPTQFEETVALAQAICGRWFSPGGPPAS